MAVLELAFPNISRTGVQVEVEELILWKKGKKILWEDPSIGECQKIKNIENKWICRMGTFYESNGLNTRDEIKARSRVNFIG